MRLGGLSWVLPVVTLQVACGSRSEAPAPMVVFGDAPDSLVVSLSGLVTERGVLSLERRPLIRVGGEDSEVKFHRIVGVALLDSIVAVANAGTQEVIVFDFTGQVIAILGGEGDGPGEYRGLSFVGGEEPGRLVIFDDYDSRVETVDLHGRVIEADSLPRFGAPLGPRIDGTLMDGSLIGRPAFDHAYAPGVARDLVPVIRFQLEHRGHDTLFVVPGDEHYTFRDRSVRAPLPFGASLLIHARDTLVVAATSDRYRIAIADQFGELRTVVSIARKREAVLPIHVEQWRQDQLNTVGPESRPRVSALVDEVPSSDSLPLIGDVLLGSRGDVWVQEYSFDRGRTRWLRLATEEERIDVLEIGGRSRIMAIGDSLVVTLDQDETGVETVALWRMISSDRPTEQEPRNLKPIAR